MRPTISARLFGIALLGAALVSPFVGCNALTHIDDYSVDCFGCISKTCGDEYAACVVDPGCRQASICFQACAPTGTIESCSNQCAQDAGDPHVAAKLVSCIALSCQPLCFGNQPGGPPPDGGGDASDANDTSIDGTPGDGGCNTNAATPVDTKCISIRGPSMIAMTVPLEAGTKSFCIDEREVSWGDYDKFIAGRGATNTCGQIAECTWNDTFAAQVARPSGSADAYPVYGIDWCDAYAYCQWAGKRLCTGLDGAPASDPTKPLLDMWSFACTSGATSVYPYGAGYDPAKCVTEVTSVAPTKSKATCVGTSAPFSQVFDMSGNVAEWEDDCPIKGASSEADLCVARGGEYSSSGTDATCSADQPTQRNSTLGTLGFRCCAP
jgi:hypothetical protein